MKITSNAFGENEAIPRHYTCEGEDTHPPLDVSSLPDGTTSLALIMEDPDAPHGTFDHWVAWNIPPDIPVAANSSPGTSGRNSFGYNGYGGLCPPSGSHRYYFKVYALDSELALPEGSNKDALIKAMEGHVLDSAVLRGHYKKES